MHPTPDAHAARTDADHEQPPQLHLDGAVARIRLCRPRSHNKLDAQDIDLLRQHFETIAQTSTVRVVILEATGKTFSSGFDLNVLGHNVQQNVRAFEALADAIEQCPAITLARVHAPVYGGATDLVLACDFRIGAQGVRLFMPAVKLGLHYYPHGLRRWVSRLGLGPAKKLFLTARTIDAQEMLAIGYLDEVHPRDTLDAAIAQWVHDLLAADPGAQRSMKARLNELGRDAFDEPGAYRDLTDSLDSDALRAALQAFAAQRTGDVKTR